MTRSESVFICSFDHTVQIFLSWKSVIFEVLPVKKSLILRAITKPEFQLSWTLLDQISVSLKVLPDQHVLNLHLSFIHFCEHRLHVIQTALNWILFLSYYCFPKLAGLWVCHGYVNKTSLLLSDLSLYLPIHSLFNIPFTIHCEVNIRKGTCCIQFS